MLTDDWSDRKILAEAVIQIYNYQKCVIHVLQQQQQQQHKYQKQQQQLKCGAWALIQRVANCLVLGPI